MNQNVGVLLQEGHKYYVRVFARNEVGLSEPLETEEPVKVIRPPGNVLFQMIQTLIRAEGLFNLILPFFKKIQPNLRTAFFLS